MKNAIIVCCIGDPEKYQACVPIMEKYCERYNLNLELITQPKINFWHPIYERLQIYDYFDKYERILSIDSDTLITPHCINIFEEFKDLKKVYAVNENLELDGYDRAFVIQAVFEYMNEEKLFWQAAKNKKPLYCNSGVFLLSEPNYQYFDYWLYYCWLIGELWVKEQTPFNYLLNKYQIPVEDIDFKWNYFDTTKNDHNCERYKANIIHYAGDGFDYNNIGKYNVLKQDRKNLYGF